MFLRVVVEDVYSRRIKFMKYLGIHKLLWILMLLIYLIGEIVFAGVLYILYVIWNFRLPRVKWWYNLHLCVSDWDGSLIEDYNPWQTLTRRYRIVFHNNKNEKDTRKS